MPTAKQALPIVVLIPAYKPDMRLVTLCQTLCAQDLPVLVVDDGSGEEYRPVFDALGELEVRLVRHAVNLGKGRALKTGMNIIMQEWPQLQGVVTADADGQHTPEDIARVMGVMRETPDALVMGRRDFVGEVPFKSKAGNTITRWVYRFVTGIRCYDTQTGLRGLPAASLPTMMRIAGERYEYEMGMLLALRDMELRLCEAPIATIYLNENKGSHFRPLRDAARIYAVILRFLMSSLASFGLDYLLYLLMLSLTHGLPWLSYAVARAFSSVFNFAVNRTAVFGRRGGRRAVFRYYLLVVVQLAIGAGLVNLLSRSLGLHAGLIKIPVDVTLFFFSYVMQRDFVFSSR